MLLLQLLDCCGRDSAWLSVMVVLSACSGAQLACRKHTRMLMLTWGCWCWEVPTLHVSRQQQHGSISLDE